MFSIFELRLSKKIKFRSWFGSQGAEGIPISTRSRSYKNVADAKLENTSLSTDVVQGSEQHIYFVQGSDAACVIL